LIHQDLFNEERKKNHLQQQQLMQGEKELNLNYEDHNDEETTSILTEINFILSGNDIRSDLTNDNDKQGNQMVIQSVFVLLDTLDRWASKPLSKLRKDKHNSLPG
jgi:hypothetical protein